MNHFIAYLNDSFTIKQIYFVQSENLENATQYLKDQLNDQNADLTVMPIAEAFEKNQNDAFFIRKWDYTLVLQHKLS